MKHTLRTVIALSGAVIGAGCTFLISFDEVPIENANEAGVDAIAPGTDAERTFDVRTDGPSPQDAGKDYDLDSLTACKGNPDGLYCNGNQLSVPGADNDDLITCIGQKVVKIRYCDLGNGCIRMLDGYPDQCDECFKKETGTYCGRDIGWHPKNQHQRVRCQSGSQVGLLLCGTCVSNGTSSYCK